MNINRDADNKLKNTVLRPMTESTDESESSTLRGGLANGGCVSANVQQQETKMNKAICIIEGRLQTERGLQAHLRRSEIESLLKQVKRIHLGAIENAPLIEEVLDIPLHTVQDILALLVFALDNTVRMEGEKANGIGAEGLRG